MVKYVPVLYKTLPSVPTTLPPKNLSLFLRKADKQPVRNEKELCGLGKPRGHGGGGVISVID